MKSFKSHRKDIERKKVQEDLSSQGLLENPEDLHVLEQAGLVQIQPEPTVPHFIESVSEASNPVTYKSYDDITLNQLNNIEKYADKLFSKVGIDVEFTRHFLDRVNDARNKRQITPAELTRLFKQSYKKYGKKIATLGPDAQAVINDMRTDINMPFVLEPKGNMLELIAKTVMRKKDFRTTNPKLSFESTFEDNDITKFKNDLEDISAMIDIKSERDMIAEREKDVIQSLNEVNEAYNEVEQLGVDLIQDPFLSRYLPPDPDPNSPEDIAGHISQEGHILPEELTIVQSLSEELTQLKRSLPNMMATTAGGGEVLLKYMDDVDASARTDGYFFKYRASDGKFIGSASTVSDEQIQDVIGAMVTSNTESGITVAYQDGDGTLDFTIGTLNQDTTGNAATATALETARTIGGVSFDGTANINLPGVNASGTQDTSGTAATATLATTVTVTDSTANTNFPVVFHNESNALLDDTGALRYNPSTGELLVPKLTVAGTTTTVDTVTMEASNAIVFEGATADAHEITLTVTDPTADRTITLPNVSGTVSLITATETLTNKTLTSPVLNTPTVGTSITPASDDGATLGTSSLNWSDIYLADGAIINFGDDQDVVLTHIHNTGLRLNDGDKLNFGTSDDLSIYHDGNNSALTHSGTGDFYVQADNFYFRTSSTSENAITTTLNGAVTLYHNANAKLATTASGVSVTGSGTFSTNLVIGDGGNIGSASDTDAIAIASDGKVTFTQEIIATSLDISGDVDVDGTLETDALTIGGVTLAETIADTVGAMVGSNTETGITVTYEDGDNTLDFVIGTLNQNTTGSAATLTTARSIAMSGDVVWSVSFDGSAAVTAAGTIQSGAVETGMIAADAITAAKIADDVINSEHYVDGSIDTAHIADDAVTAAKLAAGNIVSSHLASNAVETSNINADAVTGAKIADDSINSEHYVDGSIDTAHIADDQVTEAKMADDAIGSAQLKTLSTLLIKNSSGSTLKTVHGAGA